MERKKYKDENCSEHKKSLKQVWREDEESAKIYG